MQSLDLHDIILHLFLRNYIQRDEREIYVLRKTIPFPMSLKTLYEFS